MKQQTATLPKVHDLYEAPYTSFESKKKEWIVYVMEMRKGEEGNGLALYFPLHKGVRAEYYLYFTQQQYRQETEHFIREVRRFLQSLDSPNE